jgi:glycosyltransferase involved in cell wall biosynthesis
VVAALDTALAALVGVFALLGAGVTRLFSRHRRRTDRKVLMVFNTFYSLEVLRERGAESTITNRDLDGYFDHVWTVHPLVGADAFGAAPTGPPVVTAISERHSVIEGRSERSATLRRLPRFNFALAQAELFIALSRVVAKDDVCIIRAWEPFYTALLSIGLGRLHRVAVEVRIPGNFDKIYESVGELAFPKLIPSRRLERAIGRFTLARADQVVALSDDNREYALNNGAREERIAQSSAWSLIDPVHLIDPAERPAVADFGLGDRPFVIAVTRLEPVKFPEDVVEALAKARQKMPELGGLVIGDGSMRQQLHDRASELGLEGHLIFLNSQDQIGISQALTSAAVVLAPLAGLALAEAALSATPVVAYDYEWHSELVVPGETGVLVPHRDIDAMAAAACALIAEPDRATRLGAAAREHALERMDRPALLAAERALVDRVLAVTA